MDGADFVGFGEDPVDSGTGPTPAGCGTWFMRCCWTGTTGFWSWGHPPKKNLLITAVFSAGQTGKTWRLVCGYKWSWFWERVHTWLFHLAGISWLSWNAPQRCIWETFYEEALICFSIKVLPQPLKPPECMRQIYRLLWTEKTIAVFHGANSASCSSLCALYFFVWWANFNRVVLSQFEYTLCALTGNDDCNIFLLLCRIATVQSIDNWLPNSKYKT